MDKITLECKEYVDRILKQIKIARTAQIVSALESRFGFDSDNQTLIILEDIQRAGSVMLSVDGWIIDREVYEVVTGDYKLNRIDYQSKRRIPYNFSDYVGSYYKTLVDCFWVVVLFLPNSEEFMTNLKPWVLSFTLYEDEEEDNKQFGGYYKVAKLDKHGGNSDVLSKIAMVRDAINEEKPPFTDVIHYIAVVENEESVEFIPKNMFSAVFLLDADDPDGIVPVDKNKIGSYYEGL